MKYIIANWKANKNFAEVSNWANEFIANYKPRKDITIIICPPFPFIALLKDVFEKFENVRIGAQDVSHQAMGPHTGEVVAENLKGIADYVIVGHSERRTLEQESEDMIEKKILKATNANINTVLCIRNTSDVLYQTATMIAYEPSEAISTSQNPHNVSVEDVVIKKKELKLSHEQLFLYGGSVDSSNFSSYMKHPDIDGVLIGQASLDASKFSHLLIEY